MSNYDALMNQAKELMEQAEAMRRSERIAVLVDIKSKMKEFEISSSELEKGSKYSHKTSESTPKYRGPNNELWSGGRGRKPTWIKDALAAGNDIERYRI